MAVGTSVRVMPSNETGTVRSIQVDGAMVTLARAGDSADVTLAGQICLPWQPEVVCIGTLLLLVNSSCECAPQNRLAAAWTQSAWHHVDVAT